jgi:hypothetical protein
MKTLDIAFDNIVHNFVSGIKGLFFVIIGVSVLIQSVKTFL